MTTRSSTSIKYKELKQTPRPSSNHDADRAATQITMHAKPRQECCDPPTMPSRRPSFPNASLSTHKLKVKQISISFPYVLPSIMIITERESRKLRKLFARKKELSLRKYPLTETLLYTLVRHYRSMLSGLIMPTALPSSFSV